MTLRTILIILGLALSLGLTSCMPPNQGERLQAAVAAVQAGDFAESLHLTELCLGTDPDDVMALLLNGYCRLVTAGDHAQKAKAVSTLEKATRLAPESFTAWYFYGWSLVGSGQSQEAVEVLEQAFTLMPAGSPHKGHLLFMLGQVCTANNLQSKGLKYVQPLLVHQPYRNWPDVYNALGMLALKRADYREAVRCFNEALKLESGHPQILQNLAVTFDLYLNLPRIAREYYLRCLVSGQGRLDAQTTVRIHNRLRQLADRISKQE